MLAPVAFQRVAIAEFGLELAFPTLLNPHGVLPPPLKACTVKAYVSRINGRCLQRGLPAPAVTAVNPLWTKVLRAIDHEPAAQPCRDTRLTVSTLVDIVARTTPLPWQPNLRSSMAAPAGVFIHIFVLVSLSCRLGQPTM